MAAQWGHCLSPFLWVVDSSSVWIFSSAFSQLRLSILHTLLPLSPETGSIEMGFIHHAYDMDASALKGWPHHPHTSLPSALRYEKILSMLLFLCQSRSNISFDMNENQYILVLICHYLTFK